jgi:hypothetical protein
MAKKIPPITMRAFCARSHQHHLGRVHPYPPPPPPTHALAQSLEGGEAPAGSPVWRVLDRRVVTVTNPAGLMVSDHRGVAATLELEA